jgi:CBS domain-containing protein
MESDLVRDAMTPSPHSIPADATAVEAARTMASEDVGSLPVVEGDELVGMVTDRDLVLQVLAKGGDPEAVRVANICSTNPVVASPDEPLDDALWRMAKERVRRLPVVSEGRVVGILAQADVAHTAQPGSTGRMVEEISKN